MSTQIDVLINVCGKPYQTALALLTLERACGRHIDRIYFVEENTKHRDVDIHTGHHGFVLDRLRDKISYLQPEIWNYCFALEPERLADTTYRHAIRYQWGWESTDKDYVLVIHNDAHFHGDVVGAMLDGIGEHIAIGHIGAGTARRPSPAAATPTAMSATARLSTNSSTCTERRAPRRGRSCGPTTSRACTTASCASPGPCPSAG